MITKCHKLSSGIIKNDEVSDTPKNMDVRGYKTRSVLATFPPTLNHFWEVAHQCREEDIVIVFSVIITFFIILIFRQQHCEQEIKKYGKANPEGIPNLKD